MMIREKTVLVAYQKRKQDEIFHPFIEEKVSIGLLFYVQAPFAGPLSQGRFGQAIHPLPLTGNQAEENAGGG